MEGGEERRREGEKERRRGGEEERRRGGEEEKNVKSGRVTCCAGTSYKDKSRQWLESGHLHVLKNFMRLAKRID